MKLKTYFASTVEAAMQLALEQLGPEAMIVNSRKTAPENRHLGEYEVVFATELAPMSGEECFKPPLTGPVMEMEAESVKRLHGEVSRLSSQIELLGRAMKRAEIKQTVSNFEGEAADVVHSLREAGFDDGFIIELLNASPADGGGSLRFRVLQLLAERLKSAPSLGRTGFGRKVVALVGPSGAGKSTLIAKLATRFGVAARRPCQILSVDSDRIGASEPLRMVAGVLGVGFRLLDDPSMLNPAMEGLRDRDLVLIDTPGFGRDEQDAFACLAQALAGRTEVDVHLVLPASMKLRDLERATRAYRPLNPSKLIFTRLDETEQLGTALETAVKAELPISFLTNGPRVPEDLEPANAAQLARRVFLPVSGGFSRKAAA